MISLVPKKGTRMTAQRISSTAYIISDGIGKITRASFRLEREGHACQKAQTAVPSSGEQAATLLTCRTVDQSYHDIR